MGPAVTLAFESRLEGIVGGIDAQTEDVQLALPEAVDPCGDAVDLDGGQEFQRKRRPARRA